MISTALVNQEIPSLTQETPLLLILGQKIPSLLESKILITKLRLKKIPKTEKLDNLTWMMDIKGKRRNRRAKHQAGESMIPISNFQILTVRVK